MSVCPRDFEAIAREIEREAEDAEGFAAFYADRARKLREDAVNARDLAKMTEDARS